MTSDHLAHDRKPEAASAGVAGARLIQPDEAFEHPVAVDVGNAGTVVLDDDGHGVDLIDHAQANVVSCVAGGVVHQIANHLPECDRITVNAPGGYSRGVDGQPGTGDAVSLGQGEVVDVDIDPRHVGAPFSVAREE